MESKIMLSLTADVGSKDTFDSGANCPKIVQGVRRKIACGSYGLACYYFQGLFFDQS